MSNAADALPPPIPSLRGFDTLQGSTLRAVLIGLIRVLPWVPLGMLDGLHADRLSLKEPGGACQQQARALLALPMWLTRQLGDRPTPIPEMRR
jgi:hypothetical protein